MKAEIARNVSFKVNTPQLLKEILGNNQMHVLRIPIACLADILAQVSNRAIELNDDKLNALMCRLALYEESDPYSKKYNQKLVDETLKKAAEL